MMRHQHEQPCTRPAEMFSSENDHRLIEGTHIVERAFFGAFPFVVNNSCIGEVVVFKTSQYDAVRKVDVFAIHKKLFIKSADLFINFSLHHH